MYQVYKVTLQDYSYLVAEESEKWAIYIIANSQRMIQLYGSSDEVKKNAEVYIIHGMYGDEKGILYQHEGID